jgi:hypothetical protein
MYFMSSVFPTLLYLYIFNVKILRKSLQFVDKYAII